MRGGRKGGLPIRDEAFAVIRTGFKAVLLGGK